MRECETWRLSTRLSIALRIQISTLRPLTTQQEASKTEVTICTNYVHTTNTNHVYVITYRNKKWCKPVNKHGKTEMTFHGNMHFCGQLNKFRCKCGGDPHDSYVTCHNKTINDGFLCGYVCLHWINCTFATVGDCKKLWVVN